MMANRGWASLVVVLIVAVIAACGGDSAVGPPATPVEVPLGAVASGITLAGHLAGKQAYFLTPDVNRPNCWMDSVHWTGTELFYGLTAIDFTKLLSGAGFQFDAGCILPAAQVDPEFDIYRAELGTSGWTIAHQSDLNEVGSDAAMSLSGGVMAFVKFHPAPGSFDIYQATRTGANTWAAPVAFPRNSPCVEDNPELYANGTKMIFESGRTVADGSACDPDPDARSLWFSIRVGGVWSLPSLIAGAPNVNTKNTQPWVDEANGYLYWTADKECICIRRIPWVNDAVAGAFEVIATPSNNGLIDLSADGKVVFLGEYSEHGDYAFIACGPASLAGDGTDPNLFLGRWLIHINLCVIPK